jgi:sulfite reductase beta subunit-like hemoprotein
MAAAVSTAEPRTSADACPGSLVLHGAEDGRLARVRVPGGRLLAEQVAALARAAELGNGLVDLTSRANVQVRGLPEGAGAELTALLLAAGLLPSAAHDRARNVIASPLAGRHPRALAAADPIVAAIDGCLCAQPALAELPGRFLFAVDDGSGLALHHGADVTLVARDAHTYVLALAGSSLAGTVAARDAAALAVEAALAFVSERASRRERAWRIAELAGGAAAVAQGLGRAIDGRLAAAGVARLDPGVLEQRDGRRAVTALAPLGRLDAGVLASLGALAAEHGGELRIGAGRTVTLVDLEPRVAAGAARRLAELGLVLEPDSGWVGLTACAGLGRCPKARFDVRAAAALRAGVRGPGAGPEHWAACERRCGEREGQPVAVAAVRDRVVLRCGGEERTVDGVDEALAVLA